MTYSVFTFLFFSCTSTVSMAFKFPRERDHLGFTVPMAVSRHTQPAASSSDASPYSPEYDSDGCSFGSDNLKYTDWNPRPKPPRRHRRRVSQNRRRRSPIPQCLFAYAEEASPIQPPPPPPTPPPVQPRLDKFQKTLTSIQTRMANLETEYSGLHAALITCLNSCRPCRPFMALILLLRLVLINHPVLLPIKSIVIPLRPEDSAHLKFGVRDTCSSLLFLYFSSQA